MYPIGATSGAPTYQLVTGSSSDPVALADLKAWLKITNNAEDMLLSSIIKAVTRNAELYTKRDFIQKTYRTYRDWFGDIDRGVEFFTYGNQCPIELRRTPVQSITSVKYYNESDVLTTVSSSVYYFTVTDGSTFSLLLPKYNQLWPSDLNTGRLQCVEIIFTAGYATATIFQLQCPDLYQAMLAHMASVYVNRGDCSPDSGCKCSNAPASAQMVYQQYMIIDFASAL